MNFRLLIFQFHTHFEHHLPNFLQISLHLHLYIFLFHLLYHSSNFLDKHLHLLDKKFHIHLAYHFPILLHILHHHPKFVSLFHVFFHLIYHLYKKHFLPVNFQHILYYYLKNFHQKFQYHFYLEKNFVVYDFFYNQYHILFSLIKIFLWLFEEK